MDIVYQVPQSVVIVYRAWCSCHKQWLVENKNKWTGFKIRMKNNDF